MEIKKIRLWEDEKNEAYMTSYILDSNVGVKKNKRPTIIICPGGAYLRTSDRESEPVAVKFASLGFNAFVLRYNTYFKSKEDGITFVEKNDRENIEVNINTRYPQPLFDLAKAMLIIKERAEEWNIDVENISVCGFSAGSHLAASLGTHWQSNLLKNKFGAESEMFKPKTIILGYPVIDYMVIKELETKSKDEMAIKLFKVSNEAVFGVSNPSDEERKSLSISYNVTSNMPPAFIWHTANDELVYAKNSLNLAVALAENNIPYELHIFEAGPHGMSLCDETTANEENQISDKCSGWFNMAVKWLKNY